MKHIQRNLFQISVFSSLLNGGIRVDQPEYFPVHLHSLGLIVLVQTNGFWKIYLPMEGSYQWGHFRVWSTELLMVPAWEISRCPVASARHELCRHRWAFPSSPCAILHCPNQTRAGHKEMSGASHPSSRKENHVSAGYLVRKIILRPLQLANKSCCLNQPKDPYMFACVWADGYVPLLPSACCFARLERALLSCVTSVTSSPGWPTVMLSCHSQTRYNTDLLWLKKA